MSTITPEQIMQKVSSGRPFVLLHLKAGKPFEGSEEERNALQMQHLAHLFQLEADGKVSVFGPVIQHPELLGIIVFNTASRDDVQKWMEDDPYIKEGYMNFECFDFFTIPGQRIAGS